jgi:DNA-binding NarL/FixJ family response regulator
MRKPLNATLTQRERDVLILVARGFTNREIADHLCTSTSAVKVFLHQACVKLGARNRAQAVILAMRHGAINTVDVYSLEELADFLASLGPEAIQTIAQLVKQKLEQKRPPQSPKLPLTTRELSVHR